MENRTIATLKEYYDELQSRRLVQEKRREMLTPHRRVVMSRNKAPNNRWYYYSRNINDKDKSYLGVGNTTEINEIKELRFLDKSISLIDKNIDIVGKALSKIQRTDYESVNNMIPDTYRGAELGYGINSSEKARAWKDKAEAIKAASGIFRPEELKVWTDDGKKVRSKSEGMIYNYLLSRGVAFVYELPMRLRGRTAFPDFTILSEIDYKTEVVIEHQGLMDFGDYRNRFADKVHRFIHEGFTPGVDIFFTFDNADGGLDMRPIKDIVRNHIKAGS